MDKALDPVLIRKLFDDLRDGTLSKTDADMTLYDEGFSLDVRDALFLMHEQNEERRAEQAVAPSNVLRNPSLSGTYTERGAPEIKVAPGWDLCYRHGEPSPLGPQDSDHACGRPEYKPISRWEFPGRVVWGEKAQCVFTRWRVMDACIWQYADVPAGTILTLQADVHAWCSNDDNPASCDGEFYFRIGIDNKGDYEPFSAEDHPSMLWGGWTRATNEYQTIEMQALAMSPTVVVFVNFWNKYRYAHNDAYIDAVRLLVETPKPDPEPEPGEYVTRAKLAELFHGLADELEYPT